MKIETEIKLAITDSEIKNIVENIETIFDCAKNVPFHQTTHQFFFDDYTKQSAFPRIRNEENGAMTLTVKAKIKENSNFFKRLELETTIGDTEAAIAMMFFWDFPKEYLGKNEDTLF